jgi:hypothetical protein
VLKRIDESNLAASIGFEVNTLTIRGCQIWLFRNEDVDTVRGACWVVPVLIDNIFDTVVTVGNVVLKVFVTIQVADLVHACMAPCIACVDCIRKYDIEQADDAAWLHDIEIGLHLNVNIGCLALVISGAVDIDVVRRTCPSVNDTRVVGVECEVNALDVMLPIAGVDD